MGPSSASGSTLEASDRQWLAERLSAASDKVFPRDEQIGKSEQQDFYFRKLLDVLIDNALRHGTPCVGGNLSELWKFTVSKIPEWRAQLGSKRGRAGYDLKSTKTMMHAWRNAFNGRIRAVSSARGRIEFVFDTPGALSDDVVLRAKVNVILPDGGSFEYTSKDLTSETRLSNEPIVEPESEEDKKRRLLREAQKYVRSVETDYLAKLRDAPLQDIEQKVTELRRARRNYRALAAAVLVVVGTGMVAYKIFFSSHPIVPRFKMSGKCTGCPNNIEVDMPDVLRSSRQMTAGQMSGRTWLSVQMEAQQR